eukprot:77191-Chlamydomonas_euryale.AAC.1
MNPPRPHSPQTTHTLQLTHNINPPRPHSPQTTHPTSPHLVHIRGGALLVEAVERLAVEAYRALILRSS